MPTPASIKEQLEQLGVPKSIQGRREVRQLSKVLQEGETVRGIIKGSLGSAIQSMGSTGGERVFIATTCRLLVVKHGWLGSPEIVTYPYGHILSVGYKTGSFLGEVVITTPHIYMRITGIWKSSVQPFAETVQEMIGASP